MVAAHHYDYHRIGVSLRHFYNESSDGDRAGVLAHEILHHLLGETILPGASTKDLREHDVEESCTRISSCLEKSGIGCLTVQALRWHLITKDLRP